MGPGGIPARHSLPHPPPFFFMDPPPPLIDPGEGTLITLITVGARDPTTGTTFTMHRLRGSSHALHLVPGSHRSAPLYRTVNLESAQRRAMPSPRTKAQSFELGSRGAGGPRCG